jgi:8-oxo-dGTP diphosphatase
VASRFTFYAASYVVLHRVEDDCILLCKRQNTDFANGYWTVPSGHVDEGEGPLNAALRECLEESGITVAPQDATLYYLSHTPYSSAGEAFGFFYKATVWSGEAENREPDKCSGMGWFPRANLPTPITGYVTRALQHLQHPTVATPSHVCPPDPLWGEAPITTK